MKKLKTILYKILGAKVARVLNSGYTFITKGAHLTVHVVDDAILYHKHSTMVKSNTFNKIEAAVILNYHAIEKGFLYDNFKFRFGIARIQTLISLLNDKLIINSNLNRSQLNAAYLALCKYYEVHKANNINIDDYFKESDYLFFKSQSSLTSEIVEHMTREDFYKNSDGDFSKFAKSRKSVRNFTGEKIPYEKLLNVIEIAKTAPSVCNRQSVKVYCVENKEKVDQIFKVQGGLQGFTKEVSQVLVLTSDRSYFYSVGERNQFYVDGGIFLMNLLYALHYNKIGACPAHWAKERGDDRKIREIIGLNPSEKVICIIPIGIAKDSFKTTLSLRRSNDEVLQVIN